MLVVSNIYPIILSIFCRDYVTAGLFFVTSLPVFFVPLLNKKKKVSISIAFIVHSGNLSILLLNLLVVQNILNISALFPLMLSIMYMNPIPKYKKELIIHLSVTFSFTLCTVLFFYFVPVSFYVPHDNRILFLISLMVCLSISFLMMILMMKNLELLKIRMMEHIAKNSNLVSQLEVNVHQKNILLAEAHHRIKNNLAIVSGMLNWQKEKSATKQTLDVLSDCSARILSIALIHKKLYERGNFNEVALDDYIRELTNEIKSTNIQHTRIQLQLQLESCFVKVEKATPCGLIINEVITNAIKHAFSDNEGIISVSLKKIQNTIVIIIKDNGMGIPSLAAFKKSETMGYNLIFSLSEQIDGQFEFSNDNGTQFVLHFPSI